MGKTMRRTRFAGNRKVRENEAKAPALDLTPAGRVVTDDDLLDDLVMDLMDFAEFIGLDDRELMLLLPREHDYIHAGGR